MNKKEIKEYIKIMKSKSEEAINLLRDASPSDEVFRTLCVNINNLDANIDSFQNKLEYMELEKANK